MRILLTSNYKVGNETGSSHVTDLLTFNLSQKNEVLYLCLGEKYRVKIRGNLKIVSVPSTEVSGVAIPIITPGLIIKIEKIVNKFAPEIIHTQNSVMISKFVQIWANQKRIPIVTTFHHIPTQAISHLFPNLSKSILTKAVEDLYSQTSLKSFLENIQGVIALNENQKREIRKVDKKIKISIINNGLDLSKFKNKTDKKLKEKINFIFMGSYIERKNQEFLVKTFKLLPPNYILNCYGKISTGKSYYDRINLIKSDNVNLFDYEKDVNKVLKENDFFISTSFKEVQSLAVIYAMSAGLPIIGLENETITELVNNTNGLKLRKNISAKKFAEEITSFVKKCNYQKLSKKAKKDSEKFDIKKVIPEIERFYRKVISDN